MSNDNGKINVTIGLCVKNAADTIKRALDSIARQDYPHNHVELIVVEGFSQDRTLSFVEDFVLTTDLTKRVFRDAGGLGLARQMVIEQAKGKYIVWVDGDLILPEDYVRGQVDFMELHPHVGIGGGKHGLHQGLGIAADLENLMYAVDSEFGEQSASKVGYLPGAEGSIYRAEAIKQVGGFDPRIKGAAEDTELSYRLKAHGWELGASGQTFYESTRPNMVSLWHQYFWYGYGGHYIFHKDPNMLSLWKMTPPAGFLAGLLRCRGAFKLTGKRFVFLLPVHYVFKRVAWLFGFLKSDVEGYGH